MDSVTGKGMDRSHSGWGMLIPRPHSFLVNSILFGGGVFFAWLEGYRGQHVSSQLKMPAWLFVLLWFLVQEVLVQQAKYMWNDIRDHERDQKIPANRIRPITQQLLATNTTIVMAGRWVFGLVLAGLLSPVLLTVVLMISSLQIVYELAAKPQAAARPTLPLFVVSAGAVLKFSAGALAIGCPPGEQRLWLYGFALFATGVVYISSFWRTEAAYFSQRGLALPRGQSAYFAQTGMAWLKVGTAVTIVSCAVLIIDGYTHFLVQVEMHAGLAFGLIISGGILCCRACLLLARGRSEYRSVVVVLCIVGCGSYSLFQVDNLIPIINEVFAATLLLVVLSIDHRLNVSMDYKQQNLIYLMENWPKLKRVARERQQRSRAMMHWRHLLQLALVLNTAKYETVQERQKGD